MKPKRKRLYFSLRSPYSWLALRRLHELLPDAPQIIEYLPAWEPDEELGQELAAHGTSMHYQPMNKAKHLYILRDVSNLARRFGYPMKWPADTNPQWDLPHLLWLAARRSGVQETVLLALQEARWERAMDITDPAVLLETMNASDLDGAGLLQLASTQDIRDEALSVLTQSYDDDVFGVPFFFVGRQRFWGIDRLGAFLETLADTTPVPDPLDRIPPEAQAAVGAYDIDAPGGCG